ncbi:MAG TPA: SGNH/GDSL hydrolase family protein [Bryobacteraceae bacterium]|nr:SGNH/GDSL hydrolase family protein [Bryobacteraceae bacterium]
MSTRLYLAHLAIPAFVLITAVQAYQRGFRGRTSTGLIALTLLWLAGGLVLFALRKRPRVARMLPNITLSVLVGLVCAAILETAITLIMPVFATGLKRIQRPPNLRIQLVGNSLAIPGKRVDTVFTTNELGMRGPSLQDNREAAFIILAIGGSTTECFALDDATAWPAVLGNLLSRGGRPVKVENTGVSGHTSSDHLYMLRTNPLVADADLITFMVGANDLGAALAFEGRPVNAELQRRADEGFGVFPLYSRSAIYKLAQFLTGTRSELRYDIEKFYEDMRRKRRQSRIIPLPDLRAAVQEYGERIRRLAEECRGLRKRCLLITQPMLWRNDLSRQEIDALWLGYVGPFENPIGYISPGELETAMSEFNRRLLEVARAEQVEAFDLAARVPGNLTVYYDDAHYTNEGARIVAESIAEYLRPTVH